MVRTFSIRFLLSSFKLRMSSYLVRDLGSREGLQPSRNPFSVYAYFAGSRLKISWQMAMMFCSPVVMPPNSGAALGNIVDGATSPEVGNTQGVKSGNGGWLTVPSSA